MSSICAFLLLTSHNKTYRSISLNVTISFTRLESRVDVYWSIGMYQFVFCFLFPCFSNCMGWGSGKKNSRTIAWNIEERKRWRSRKGSQESIVTRINQLISLMEGICRDEIQVKRNVSRIWLINFDVFSLLYLPLLFPCQLFFPSSLSDHRHITFRFQASHDKLNIWSKFYLIYSWYYRNELKFWSMLHDIEEKFLYLN